MDYKISAKRVLEAVGGSENIVSAAHCVSRLRLVIKDNKKCSTEAVEQAEGVKGVFEASGQLQIIFGAGTVNKVYEEFIVLAGISGATKEEVRKAAAENQNILKRAVKTLGDIFVPIIPAIVGSGLILGLLEGFGYVWPEITDTTVYMISYLFSSAAFVFLPILIAVSAAKRFGGNPFLGAVIGMIMIHPDLLNAWSVSGMNAADIPTASVWFGLYDINLVGYQGHVIPVVLAVWLMSTLEKYLHKVVPEIIDLFVTPLVAVFVTGYLALTVIGPIFSTVEHWVLEGARSLIVLPFGIGAAIVGGLYAPTVIAGVHHLYHTLEVGLLNTAGINIWMPVATAANVAQGAACFALAIRTKDAKKRAVALPASLSACCGIAEPAIFAVNIRYMKPFIAGCIGGVCGGLVAGITGVGASAYGITGVFGFVVTPSYAWQYMIVLFVSSVVAFVVSWILDPSEAEGREDEEGSVTAKGTGKTRATQEALRAQDLDQTVCAPAEGTVISLAEVEDETFASEILGKGIAIVPKKGQIVAPFSGTVTTIFPTKHAIGLTGKNGIELLIHIGVNTAELEGDFFTVCVKSGEEVKVGDLLVKFDMEGIRSAGYDITTPVIVTNADDYGSVELLRRGDVKPLEELLAVR